MNLEKARDISSYCFLGSIVLLVLYYLIDYLGVSGSTEHTILFLIAVIGMFGIIVFGLAFMILRWVVRAKNVIGRIRKK